MFAPMTQQRQDFRRNSGAARLVIFRSRARGSRSLLQVRVGQIVAILLLAIAVSIGTARPVQSDDASEAILDEIVAGSDANLALIQHGTAKYVAERWDYSLPPNAGDQGGVDREANTRVGDKPAPFVSEYTVRFDYPRLRFDWRGNGLMAEDRSVVIEECYVCDGNHLIEYDMPQFLEEQTAGRRGSERGSYRGVSNPSAHNVQIFAKRDPKRKMMHPRRQIGRFTAAEDIRRLRENPKARPMASREPDGLLRYFDEGRGFRAERWVSPKQGYCLVRAKTWNRRSTHPVFVTVATAREVAGGAYVIDHIVNTHFAREAGPNGPTPKDEDEATLVSIDLTAQVYEKLFTIDGLDIPGGTPINDRIEGRRYRYAVAAVKERDIIVPEVAGPMTGRGWAAALYVFAGIVLLGVGFVGHRIQKRRRSSAGFGGSGTENCR